MPSYRIIISYLPEKEVYKASAPELNGCEVEAATRAEALTQLEEEMEAQVENIKEQGGKPPVPVEELELDGALSFEVTPELHRELLFLARAEKTELPVLLNDLLLRAVTRRWSRGKRGGGRGQQRGRQDGGRGRGRRQQGQGDRYHNIMEDRAEFIDYVRKMEGGGGRSRGGRGSGRGGRRK